MANEQAVDELADLLGWTTPADPRLSWPATETATGVRFPADFKRLMTRFPSGAFGDRFYVYSPVQNAAAQSRFQDEARKFLDWYRDLRALAADNVPYPLHPEPGGLLPWGSGDESCFLWRPQPEHDPDSWPTVLVDIHATNWGEYPGTASELLLDLLTGRLTGPPGYFTPQPEERGFFPFQEYLDAGTGS